MIRVGESAYLLEFASPDCSLTADRRLTRNPLPGMVELVPGARTLLVLFDGEALAEESDARVKALDDRLRHEELLPPDERLEDAGAVQSRCHEIRVRYRGEDLDRVASHAGLDIAEVIELHHSVEYRVAFLGFQPGFAYLSGLPPRLVTPRLASPRSRVPAGSVAIGGEWSGIYPGVAPGGWNLIGTAEAWLFDPSHDPPARFAPGDLVRFLPA